MAPAVSDVTAADEALARKLAALDALSRDELAERWAATYGCPPPAGVRRELLAYAAAWHLQARHSGGLRPETKKLLKRAMTQVERRMVAARVAASSASGTAANGVGLHDAGEGRAVAVQPITPDEGPERRTLSPGTRLLRDWQGRTHVVDVVEGGFLYGGKRHHSLSAIAKQITGAHWSGPRFFGL